MLFLPLQKATGQVVNCLRENGRVHKAGKAPKEDLWPRHSRAVLYECFPWTAPLAWVQPALAPALLAAELRHRCRFSMAGGAYMGN